MKYLTKAIVSVLSVILLAACSPAPRQAPQGEIISALNQAEADAILQNAMQGYINGDYNAWSQDWSVAMKSGITEADFLAFRDQVTTQYGKLISTGPAEILPGMNKGYVRWSTLATFEKGQVSFNFGFSNEGKLIEGVLPEPVK